MNSKQVFLILGLGVAGVLVFPGTTTGLCLMCAAVGAYLSVVLA